VNRYNALIFTVAQESYGFNFHTSDFAQVDDYANAVIVDLSPHIADMGGLNSTTEPQARVCPPTPFVSSTFINHPDRSSDQFTVVSGMGVSKFLVCIASAILE
jgi:hypothetical protein